MSNHKKNFGIFVIVMIIICAGLLYSSYAKQRSNPDTPTSSAGDQNGSVAGTSTNSSGEADSYISSLTKALSSKGVVMYGSFNDDQTKLQKSELGDAFANIDYVECDAGGSHPNPDECVANSVTTYPTWIYQEKSFTGVQSLADLAKIIGFSEGQSAE